MQALFSIPLFYVIKISQNAIEIFNYNQTEKNDFKRLEGQVDRRRCSRVTKFLTTLDAFVAKMECDQVKGWMSRSCTSL
jgi:hypothetical protein